MRSGLASSHTLVVCGVECVLCTFSMNKILPCYVGVLLCLSCIHNLSIQIITISLVLCIVLLINNTNLGDLLIILSMIDLA